MNVNQPHGPESPTPSLTAVPAHNPAEAYADYVENQVPTPETGLPTREDGSLYRFELVYAGFTARAYADTHADLINYLIDGYSTMSQTEQWHARLAYMARAQTIVQASLNTHPLFGSLPHDQKTILQGSRHEPIAVASWDCPVPLILIASHYKPAGDIEKPRAVDGMPPNVIYVDPSDDATFLESLHDISVVSLHEAISAPALATAV